MDTMPLTSVRDCPTHIITVGSGTGGRFSHPALRATFSRTRDDCMDAGGRAKPGAFAEKESSCDLRPGSWVEP